MTKKTSTTTKVSKAQQTSEQHLANTISKLRDVLGTEPLNEGTLTPFGSHVNSMCGNIDMAILQGETDLFKLAQAAGTPSTRKSDPDAIGKACVRVKEHIHWLATLSETHGGVLHALSRVHSAPKSVAKRILPKIKCIDTHIRAQFSEYFDSKGTPRNNTAVLA